jgi:hypothetical protein
MTLDLADLATAEGLEKWRAACAAARACRPALRFYSAEHERGATLREAIADTPGAHKEAGSWLLWALIAFGAQMAPDFRLWLMLQCVDEGTAANLYFQALRGTLPFEATREEKGWLRSQWHSEGAGEPRYPEFERQEKELR